MHEDRTAVITNINVNFAPLAGNQLRPFWFFPVYELEVMIALE
jgi:hypothetical protein